MRARVELSAHRRSRLTRDKDSLSQLTQARLYVLAIFLDGLLFAGFNLPGGVGVRVDTAAYSDCVIPPYYDSLIAKLIAWGEDREEARARHGLPPLPT